MTAPLDTARLAKLLALASSPVDAEAVAAVRRAGALLKAAGQDWTDIANTLQAPASRPVQTEQPRPSPTTTDIFGGFDDWMERKEPGWKAKQAAERAERLRREAEEHDAVVAKYGSADAALAPCERERLVAAALGDLVTRQPAPHERWTDTIGTIRYSGDFISPNKVSPEVWRAIESAYPLPATIADALAELEYWRGREREMLAALKFPSIDAALDLVACGRMERVRLLAEAEIEAQTFADLVARLDYHASLDFDCDQTERAIFRDLRRLAAERVQCGQHGADDIPSVAAVQVGHPARASDRRAAVLAMLSNSNTANLSDREIARRVGCSPSTVGALRRKVGRQ